MIPVPYSTRKAPNAVARAARKCSRSAQQNARTGVVCSVVHNGAALCPTYLEVRLHAPALVGVSQKPVLCKEDSMHSAPIPAAQYLRMSTDLQQYSLTNQAAAIQHYATIHNFEVVQTYVDPGKSGLYV